MIASVPVALPLLLKVTLAIGASFMATAHSAIVTRISALQDIASMNILLTDKTGTITTGSMTVDLSRAIISDEMALRSLIELHLEADGDFVETAKRKDASVLLLALAALGSNLSKVDDAIDGAIFRSLHDFDTHWVEQLSSEYERVELTGFNPEYKRTLATLRIRKSGETLFVAKGLLGKVFNTGHGGVDSSPRQWQCVDDRAVYRKMIEHSDALAAAGFKSIAVAAGCSLDEMHFMGIFPLLDPPRSDSAKTITRLHEAGVEVKMVTGDNQNIAKTTAHLVGMSASILLGADTRDGTHERDEIVRHSGGFAQVLPRDKRECVRVLQRAYGLVVGMTGGEEWSIISP